MLSRVVASDETLEIQMASKELQKKEKDQTVKAKKLVSAGKVLAMIFFNGILHSLIFFTINEQHSIVVITAGKNHLSKQKDVSKMSPLS